MNELHRTIPGNNALATPIDFEEVDIGDVDDSLSEKAARSLRLCWRSRKLFLAVVSAGIILSLMYALLLPNIYTSTATLMPPDDASPYSNVMGMLSNPAASFTSEAFGLNSPGELYVSILESRTVQDALTARFDLIRYYETRTSEDARRVLKGNSNITEDLKSGVITIVIKDTNQNMAANLANGYVAELNRVVTGNSTSTARRERVFLEGRLKEVKRDLDDSSKALSQFSSKSKTINVDTQVKSMVEEGLKLESELMEGRSELAAMRQSYSEDNVRVKAAEARVAELQRQVNTMGGISGAAGTIGKSNESLYPSATELPALGLTYSDLERKVKVDEELWEALTKQYEAAKVDEVKEIPTIRVLDPGIVPQKKSSPTRWLIMVIGTFLSLAAAFLLVLAIDSWREIDPETEPKKILMKSFGALLNRRTRQPTSQST